MSKENLTLFIQKAQEDEPLQEKLTSLITQNAEDQEKMAESMMELGLENGYKFSKEDMQQLAQENMAAAQASGELDEAQLEAVSGGIAGVGIMVSVTLALA